MEEILEIIKKRRSIREFQKKEIPEELIGKLIESLIWAPSAGNLQSRKFYFIFDEKVKEGIAEGAGQSFISRAPLIVVGCADNNIGRRYGERGKNLYALCDMAVSVQNIMLLAHRLGLGSCWVGAFEEEQIARILKLPENLIPIVILPVGYPDEKPNPPQRISKKEAVEFIKPISSGESLGRLRYK